MLPIIAIVGRPNVGKSTLFNALTKTRDALVYDLPGVTRDRQYGRGLIGKQPYWIVDTAGIVEPKDESPLGIMNQTVELANHVQLAKQTALQINQAIEEADCLLWLVDAQAGLTVTDQEIAKQLRPYTEKVVLVVNKIDREKASVAINEFYQLGFGEPQPIAAKKGRGVYALMTKILNSLVEVPVSALSDVGNEADGHHHTDACQEEGCHAHHLSAFGVDAESDDDQYEIHDTKSIGMRDDDGMGVRVAVIGRPNVGKSTLINRIFGEDRVIVFDQPGTTRDSIYIPFVRPDGTHYTLIDTAGVRRSAKVTEVIEKFSILKTLQAISEADVCVLVLNARDGLTDQDMHLVGHILEAGRGLVIAVNKWDGLSVSEREQLKTEMERRLSFVRFARRYFISALHGSGVGHLYHAVDEAYAAMTQDLTTNALTNALGDAVTAHQPPVANSRRIRLRYAHLGGRYPLVIIVHGKQTEELPKSYQRYLASFYRDTFNLVGVPINIRFKNDENPYAKK